MEWVTRFLTAWMQGKKKVEPTPETPVTHLAQDDNFERVTEPDGFTYYQYVGPAWVDQGEMLEGERLRTILNEIISPRVSHLGLTWNGQYDWIGPSDEQGVRKMVSYMLLKGMRGVVAWGLCFDFVKVPSGSKLVFNRTEKSAKQHLFEWCEAYNRSFTVGDLGRFEGKGVGVHRADVARDTITRTIESELPNIEAWFGKAGTLEDVVEIAKFQYDEQGPFGKVYSLHWPSTGYVLAHIYAKLGRHDEANQVLEKSTDEMKPEMVAKVRQHLQTL